MTQGLGVTVHADFWTMIRKVYAVGILVYFTASGVLGLSISDFSGWLSFTGRHALYALAWHHSGGGRDQCVAGTGRPATGAAVMMRG